MQKIQKVFICLLSSITILTNSLTPVMAEDTTPTATPDTTEAQPGNTETTDPSSSSQNDTATDNTMDNQQSDQSTPTVTQAPESIDNTATAEQEQNVNTDQTETDDQKATPIPSETPVSTPESETAAETSKNQDSEETTVDQKKNFDSARLIVTTDNVNEISKDKGKIIGKFDNTYLIQYDTADEAKKSYEEYIGKNIQVDNDIKITIQETPDGNKTTPDNLQEESTSEKMTSDDNTFNKLSDSSSVLSATEGISHIISTTINPEKDKKVVALIDSGVSADTENVKERVSVIGDSVDDDNGHGTRMAKYITEENPDAQILSIKVVDKDGSGDLSALYAGIQYAIKAHVDIINISLSAFTITGSPNIESVIQEATDAGITVVGAAGNSNMDTKWTVPGCVQEAVIAGAMTPSDTRLEESNYGDNIDVYVLASSTSEASAKLSGLISKEGVNALSSISGYSGFISSNELNEKENTKTDTGKWENKDGKWYHLNADGNYDIGLIDINDNTYYFNEDGSAYSGWLNLNDHKYYFDNTNYQMCIGWKDIDKKVYYFYDPNGVVKVDGYEKGQLVTDVENVKGTDGHTYSFNDKGVAKSDNKLMIAASIPYNYTNQRITFVVSGNGTISDSSDGINVTNTSYTYVVKDHLGNYSNYILGFSPADFTFISSAGYHFTKIHLGGWLSEAQYFKKGYGNTIFTVKAHGDGDYSSYYTDSNGNAHLNSLPGNNMANATNGGQYYGWIPGTNSTFTAYFEPNSYNFTLNSNGGVFSDGTTSKKNPDGPTLIFDSGNYSTGGAGSSRIPSRTGYTFDGYYTDPNGGVKLFDSNCNAVEASGYWEKNGSSLIYKHVGDLTVYAHWTRNNYALNLNMLLPDGSEPYTTGAAGTFQLSLDGGATWTGDIYNETTACSSVPYGADVRIRNIKPASGLGLKLASVDGATDIGGGVYRLYMPAQASTINIRTEYKTYNLTVLAKTVGGSTSQKKYFPIIVTISWESIGEVYNVDLSNAEATTKTDDVNTESHTNPSSLTMDGTGTIEQTFWLKGGQSIKIGGLKTSDYYRIAENIDQLSSSQYKLTAAVSGDTKTGSEDPQAPAGYQEDITLVEMDGNYEVHDTSITADTTVTFTHTKTEYTITFNANGGKYIYRDENVTTHTMQTESGTQLGDPFPLTEASRDGFEDQQNKNGSFTRLYTAPTGGTQYDKNHIPTSDETYYNHWFATVKYDANGGTGTMSNSMFDTNATNPSVTLINNAFTRTGYTFSGWNTAKNGSGKSYNDGQKVTDIKQDVTLYAQWKHIQHTITRRYRLQNTDGSWSVYTTIDSKKYDYGTVIPAWNRAADATYKSASIAAYIVADKDDTLSVDVYRNTSSVVIQYRLQNADGSYPTTYQSAWSGSLRTGESHTWNRAADATYKAASATVSYNGGTKSVNVERNSGHFIIKANGGSGDRTTSVLYYGQTNNNINPMPTRTGYTLNGLYTSASGGTKVVNANGTPANDGTYSKNNQWLLSRDVTLYAQWSTKHYNLTLNPNGGLIDGKNDAKILSPDLIFDSGNWNNVGGITITRRGYTLDGWYTTATGGSKIYNADGTCTNEGTYWNNKCYIHDGNLTVYAHWTAITYTATFNANGGLMAATSWKRQVGMPLGNGNPNLTKGAQYLPTNSIGNSTSLFTEDADSPTGGSRVFTKTNTTNNGGPYYVHIKSLTEGTTYTYTVVAKGTGTWELGNEKGLNFSQQMPSSYTSYVKSGVANNSSYQADVFYSTEASANIHISTVFLQEGGLDKLPTPTRTGYTFQGWYTAANGGTKISNQTVMPASDQTYYAHWKANNYNVTIEDWFVDANNNRKVKLATQTKSYTYNTTAKGSDIGTNVASGVSSSYKYHSDTSATVPANNNLVVYRYFYVWNDVNILNPSGIQDYLSGNIQLSNDGTNWGQNVTNEDTHSNNMPWGSSLYIKFVSPYYDYYEFDNVTGADATTTPNVYKRTINGPATITIRMKYKQYSIAYNLKGGTIAGNETSYNYGSPAITLKTPVRNGYTFTGWTGSNGNTAQTSVTIPTHSKGNKSYTANWSLNSGIITANNRTYDGTSKALVSAAGFPSDVTLQYSTDGTTYSGSIPSRSDAGTYTVYWKATSPNAVGKSGSVNVTINKKAVTIESGSASKEYDGNSLINHNVTTSGFVTGQSVTASYTGVQTLVGSSKNTFSYTANNGTNLSNYTVTKKEGTLTVTNRSTPWAIIITSKTSVVTYDGKEHSVSGFNTLTFNENGHAYTVSGLNASAKGTNAGTYTNTITGTAVVKDTSGNDVTKQFKVNTTNGKLNINKATPTFTLSEKSGYTAYPSNHQFTVSVNSGGKLSATSSNTKTATVILNNGTVTMTPVKVGTATITVSSAETSNYKTGSTSYVLTVTPGTITVTTKNAVYTYDGTAKAAGTVNASVPQGTVKIEYLAQRSTTWSTTLPTYVNAGTYTTQYRVTADNYNTITGFITTTINKAVQGRPTVHIPNLTYNGTNGDNGTVQNLGYVTTGNGGTTITYSASQNGTYSSSQLSQTNAGIYTTYYKIKGDANHTDYSGSFNTTIKKKQPTLTLSPTSGSIRYPNETRFTYSYNGDAAVTSRSDNTSIASISQSGKTISVNPVNTNRSTTVTVTAAEGKNYLSASAKYTVTVTNVYHITYNGNGSTSGSMKQDNANYGSPFMTSKNAFERTGYSFNGWNEKADGTGVVWGLNSHGVYESGNSWTWTYNKDITLYAQWNLKQIQLTIQNSIDKYDGSNGNVSFFYHVTGTDITGKVHDEIVRINHTGAGKKSNSIILPYGNYTVTPVTNDRYTTEGAQTANINSDSGLTVNFNSILKNNNADYHSDEKVNSVTRM